MTEKRKIGISRIIPGPLLLNGYSAMEFLAMLEQFRAHDSFDAARGITVHIAQVTEEEK